MGAVEEENKTKQTNKQTNKQQQQKKKGKIREEKEAREKKLVEVGKLAKEKDFFPSEN